MLNYSVLKTKIRHRAGVWVGIFVKTFPNTTLRLRRLGFPISAFMPVWVSALRQELERSSRAEADPFPTQVSGGIFQEQLWSVEDHIGLGLIRIPLIRTSPPSLEMRSNLLSLVMPGDSYKFSSERSYLTEYGTSAFAWCPKKGGWDSLRLIEIASQGCFPIVPNVDKMPLGSLVGWPIPLLEKIWHMAKGGDLRIPSEEERLRLATLVRDRFSAENQSKAILAFLDVSDTDPVVYAKLGPIQNPDFIADGFLIGFARARRGQKFANIGTTPRYLEAGQKSDAFRADLYGGGFGYSGELQSELDSIPVNQGDYLTLESLLYSLERYKRDAVTLVISRAEQIRYLDSGNQAALRMLSSMARLVFLDGGDLPATDHHVQTISKFGTYFRREC